MTRRRPRRSIRAVWIIPILAVVTLTLGTNGWMEHGVPPASAFYRAVCLFDVGNSYYPEDVVSGEWRFAVGRWTGLGVVFSAAIAALGALLRERLVLGVARYVRQQVVVVGSEGLATKAYDEARFRNRSVVWLGADSLGVDSFGAIALPWPPQDHVTTVLSYSQGADHVLIAASDDAEALSMVRAARLSAPKAFITAIMRDERLAEDAAATLNQPRTRVLSGAAIAARRLNHLHPPFLLAREKKQDRIHAVIIGFGQVGQAIARDLIVNCRTTELGLPAITIIDPRAAALEGVLKARVPELEACAHFTFIAGQIGTESVTPDPTILAEAVAAVGPLTAAYVCLRSDAEALGAAAMLQSVLRRRNVRHPDIFIRLRDSNTVGDGLSGAGLDALIPFGDLDEVLRSSEFLSSTPDALARAFSEAYRASLPPEQRLDPANTSARPWDSLNETFRQANRDAVAHIPAKLASAGIDPGLWRGKDGLPRLTREHPLFNTAEECEALARLEHERWNAQRRMDGWRVTRAPKKDEAMRRHPSLLPYDDLSEEVKEFDRIYVRETQAILLSLR
jgi:hypothetical protein